MEWVKLAMRVGILLCMAAIGICGGMLIHTHVADLISAIELFIVICGSLLMGVFISESTHR